MVAIPAAVITSPAVIVARAPDRAITAGMRGAIRNTTTETGSIRIPAASGERPWANWKYWVRMKTMP